MRRVARWGISVGKETLNHWLLESELEVGAWEMIFFLDFLQFSHLVSGIPNKVVTSRCKIKLWYCSWYPAMDY